MNYSTAVFLINDDVRAMKCSYEENGGLTIFKTFDPTIEEGDLVVVQTSTRHKMTVVKVEEVDVDIDVESFTEVDWIVSRIDLDQHKRVVAKEKAAINKIKSAEKTRKRNELRASLLADVDDAESLKIEYTASNDDD